MNENAPDVMLCTEGIHEAKIFAATCSLDAATAYLLK